MKYEGADVAAEINGKKFYYYKDVGKWVSESKKSDMDTRIILQALNTFLGFRDMPRTMLSGVGYKV